MNIKTHKSSWLRILILVALLSVSCIVIFLLNGQITTISGESTSNTLSEYMICNSETILYPFFTYDNSDKKDLIIKIIFNSNSYTTISLEQDLYYQDTQSASSSRDINTAAINNQFGSDGFFSHAMNSHFQIIDNKVQFNLFISKSDYEQTMAKYFLLDADNNDSEYDQEKLYNLLTQKGFNCTVKK